MNSLYPLYIHTEVDDDRDILFFSSSKSSPSIFLPTGESLNKDDNLLVKVYDRASIDSLNQAAISALNQGLRDGSSGSSGGTTMPGASNASNHNSNQSGNNNHNLHASMTHASMSPRAESHNASNQVSLTQLAYRSLHIITNIII